MTAPVGTEEFAANLALGHLGKPEIAAMSDDNKRARKARQQFPAVRDALLRRKWWNFATAWTTPAADVVESRGPLKKRYPMPADCVRVRFVENLGDDEWAIESGQAEISGVQVEAIVLVTNAAAPNVCYTRRIEAVRLWDALFLDCFSYMLASAMAVPLGKSRSTAAALAADAEEKLSTAATTDSKERAPSAQRPETSWLAGRRGLRTYPR